MYQTVPENLLDYSVGQNYQNESNIMPLLQAVDLLMLHDRHVWYYICHQFCNINPTKSTKSRMAILRSVESLYTVLYKCAQVFNEAINKNALT